MNDNSSKAYRIDFTTQDGTELVGYYYEQTGPIRGVVVFAGGVAVPQHLYKKCAQFFAMRGYASLTFDYRGISESKFGPMRRRHLNLRNWGEEDLEEVLRWTKRTHPGMPLFLIGHSAGGQMAGLTPQIQRVDKIVYITSQSGYWGHWPRQVRAKFIALWYLVIPSISMLLGYFPAKRLGLGENIPGYAAREWARWCRTPQYFPEEDELPSQRNFLTYKKRILWYSFTDDPWATKDSVEALAKYYKNALIERRHISPESVQLEKIGHFGYFRSASEVLWEAALHWLEHDSDATLIAHG